MRDRWLTLLDPPSVTGSIRQEPEDFRVEEIPAYLPAGRGDHLFLWVEKRNRTSDEVTRALARQMGLKPGQIGCAGLKDRAALTRQWFSIPFGARKELDSFRLTGVTILRSELHTNKLKTGHLKGNNFRIRIRELRPDDFEEIARRCTALTNKGVPNYFGPQRFGRHGRNEEIGREALRTGKGLPDRRTLRFLLSAVQSGLFNDLLSLRLKRGLFHQALVGDLMIKANSGGRFICEDPEREQIRMDAQEIHPSGPIFGPKMQAPRGQPGDMEQDVLRNSGLSDASFKKYPKLTRGTRRPLRLMPEELTAEPQGNTLVLSFSLVAGGYATSVLRELIVMSPDRL